MLKLGDKNITKLYYGDKAISKAYYGDKLVFQAGDGGRFVESIIFDGASYIDTGYKPNPNTSATCTYYPYYNTVFSCIFGTQDTATTNRFYAVLSSTLYRVQLNSGNISQYYGVDSNGLAVAKNGTFTSIQQKVGLTIDNYNKQISIESDELTKTFDMATYNSLLGTVNCQYNLLLGNRSTAGVPTTTNSFKGEIYGLQIKESDVLIQDLRPYVDADGVACFKDVVTNTLFYNQGTGTLGYTEE